MPLLLTMNTRPAPRMCVCVCVCVYALKRKCLFLCFLQTSFSDYAACIHVLFKLRLTFSVCVNVLANSRTAAKLMRSLLLLER